MQDMLQAWRQAGAILTLPGSGLQVYYRDIGDAGAAPADTALLMHGFPESSFSYHKVVIRPAR